MTRKLFYPYLLAGYPDDSAFSDLLDLTIKYADVIEIGIPFSDPVADGPIIQKAATQVLSHPFSIDSIFGLLSKKRSAVPIALMTYANPILAFGRNDFFKAAAESGVRFLIVPDIPMEEATEWKEHTRKSGLTWISFVSLTTRPERLKRIVTTADGFIYLVSLTGITGAEMKDPRTINRKALEIREHTNIPLALGFGIKSPDDARPYLETIDAFIVGSKIIELAGQSLKDVETFYESFCDSIAV
jgi:tryptophan synthase alpha chain